MDGLELGLDQVHELCGGCGRPEQCFEIWI